MLDNQDPGNKGDRNKIYFLIVVIIALLGTNAFLFFKDKHEKQRFVNSTTERDRLKLEVEKIEVEFDKVNQMNVALTVKLQQEHDMARAKIADLKQALQKGEVTRQELGNAQTELKKLKIFINTYKDDLGQLERENAVLKIQRDSLERSVNSAAAKAQNLERRNNELNEKVKISAALKAFNERLIGYRVKNSGKNIEVHKADAAKKLITYFDVIPNNLASRGYHKIYLRVFDPSGNLVADEKNMFEADGQEMQYSEMITIAYQNDRTPYQIEWVNPKPFMKGTYSIILYANGYTMGKAALEFN